MLWFKFGELSAEVGNFPLARHCFQEALHLNEEHWPSLTRLSEVWLGFVSLSLPAFCLLFSYFFLLCCTHKSESFFVFFVAQILFAIGDYGACESLLRKHILRLDPQNATALTLLSELQESADNFALSPSAVAQLTGRYAQA